MNWGEVELEPEVDDWFDTLDQDDKETAAFYVDLLAERGVLLGEPYLAGDAAVHQRCAHSG
jgi:hypothetical protein